MLRHAGQQLNAGGAGGGNGEARRKHLLELYQRFVRVEEHRLRILHRGGAGGLEVVQGRSALLDVVLQRIFADTLADCAAGQTGETPRLALVALGGYGRAELSPHSDIDVMFLHELSLRNKEEERFLHAMVEGVLYLMWDIGFKVGYSCRSIKDCLQMAERDMVSKTSLIEARWLAGDRELFARFEAALVNECVRKTVDEYVAARLRDQEERHDKFGDTVFLQEPNVKNGCGGLRDYQNLLWMAYFKYGARSVRDLEQRGFLSASERKQLEVAYDFLLRVRNELHYLAGRAADVITLSLQGKIAAHFGYRQRDQLRRIEALMRDYYLHARTVFLLTNTLAQRLALKNPGLPEGRSLQAFLARRLTRDVRKDGFLFRGTMALPTSQKIFTEDPLRLIRMFRHAQMRQVELSPDLQSLARDHLVLVDRKFQRDPHARDTFLAILAERGEAGRTLRWMHEIGFLGKFLPEFGKLTCLVQHEFYHRYTADEHTLLAVQKLDETLAASSGPAANFRKLYHELDRPDVLNLALLLHDTGRAVNTPHHATASARNAQRLAERWQLDTAARDLLLFLVKHHADLSAQAQRRDLDDPESIRAFARLVQTPQRLDALHLMTYADAQATGAPQSQWLETLRWELYEKTRRALLGSEESAEVQEQRLHMARKDVAGRCGREISEEEQDAHFTLMPRRYWLATRPEDIADDLALVHEFLRRQVFARDERATLGPVVAWKNDPDRGHTRVSVCCWDRPRLFARMAGAFAVAGINILSAQIYTRRDDVVLDTFRVTDAQLGAVGDERTLRLFEATLNESLQRELDLRALILQQPPPQLPPRPEEACVLTQVRVSNAESATRTLIEVQAEDCIGLLFAMVDAISSLGLEISSAQITTEKGAALDTFYVTDAEGRRIEEAERLEQIQQAIVAEVEQLQRLARRAG